MDRVILHIDFDSYFASCEQQFNPLLRGKPIGITAQNGRTCIIAASREAKKLGVKSPSRTFDALEIVPTMVFVPAHFEKYWEITQKFLDICKDYSPYVELFSLDEVFMDITRTQNLFGGKYELINKIKERIKAEIGEFITVSVGISHNKLLAKLGSRLKKPNGLFEITKENLEQVYATCKLTDICGIGERMAKRLNRLGIYTLLELKNSNKEQLRAEFGRVYSLFLRNIALGFDDASVTPYYEEQKTKSIGRNYCLPENEYNKRAIFQNIYELCEEVGIKLRRLGKSAKTAGIYLGGSKNIGVRKTASDYFDSGKDLYKILTDILNKNNFTLEDKDYIRRISIWVGNLEDKENLTLSLFDEDNKKKNISKTVDGINERFGDHTIRNGFLLYSPNLKTVPNGWMADKYERLKLSKIVFS